MIAQSILDLIGKTPLLRLKRIEESISSSCQIYAKLENRNPAGSAKDRAVKQMLLDLQAQGLLHPGSTLIEPTSGNTGIALAALGCYFSYHIVIIMPSSMSEQRRTLMKIYNAELILVDGGMSACVEKAKEMQKKIPGSLILGQFVNPSNPKAHYLTTGPEIHQDLPEADYILAGFGTGGTISGIGQYYKENKFKTKIIALEPASSPLLTQGKTGRHRIQGIGADFIPANFHREYIDEIRDVGDEEALQAARLIVRKEGILVGISSGAALAGACDLIREKKLEKQKLVVIFPDEGERYTWQV
jgi:cysteine synthase A